MTKEQELLYLEDLSDYTNDILKIAYVEIKAYTNTLTKIYKLSHRKVQRDIVSIIIQELEYKHL